MRHDGPVGVGGLRGGLGYVGRRLGGGLVGVGGRSLPSEHRQAHPLSEVEPLPVHVLEPRFVLAREVGVLGELPVEGSKGDVRLVEGTEKPVQIIAHRCVARIHYRDPSA